MTAADVLRRLHQHRMWVNAKLLAAAAELNEDQLRQAFDIGQGSVWKTLTHLYAAEYVWLGTLLGDETARTPGDVVGKLPGNQEGDDAAQSLAELQQRWEELDRRWQTYLQNLTDESLEESVTRVSTSSGAGIAFATRRSDILMHVCTHAQYTTAQLVNMLRRLGCDSLPDVMLISLARQEAKVE